MYKKAIVVSVCQSHGGNSKIAFCKDLHLSFVVLSGWCWQLYWVRWKAGHCCTIGIMSQTCISTDKQLTIKERSDRESIRVRESRICSSIFTHRHWWERPQVTSSTPTKKLQHEYMTEFHPKFNNNKWTRKCVSGNLSEWKIKNNLLY